MGKSEVDHHCLAGEVGKGAALSLVVVEREAADVITRGGDVVGPECGLGRGQRRRRRDQDGSDDGPQERFRAQGSKTSLTATIDCEPAPPALFTPLTA